jgi:hypothetical protein
VAERSNAAVLTRRRCCHNCCHQAQRQAEDRTQHPIAPSLGVRDGGRYVLRRADADGGHDRWLALLSSAQRQYETVYTDLAWRKHVKLGVHVKRVGVEQWLRCDEEATLAVGLEATVTREPSPGDEEQDA